MGNAMALQNGAYVRSTKNVRTYSRQIGGSDDDDDEKSNTKRINRVCLNIQVAT